MCTNLNLNMFEHLMCQWAVHSMPQVGSLQDFPSLTQIHGGTWHTHIYVYVYIYMYLYKCTYNYILATMSTHIQCIYKILLLLHVSYRIKKSHFPIFPPIFQPQILVTHRSHLLPHRPSRFYDQRILTLDLCNSPEKSCFSFPFLVVVGDI